MKSPALIASKKKKKLKGGGEGEEEADVGNKCKGKTYQIKMIYIR